MIGLKNLKLDLSYNNLGKNKNNLKILSEGISKLNSLKNLELNLNNNIIGMIGDNMKQIS